MSHNSDLAIDTVLGLEGGYINNPSDPGGETKYGISKKSHPKLDIKKLTKEKAKQIYYDEYWAPYSFFEKITSPLVATKLFVAGVNMGQKQANLCMQRALRSFSYLDIDGIIGTKSLEAINKQNAKEIVPAFNSECAGRYRLLASNHERLKKFLKGWLNRAYMKLDIPF